MNWELPDVHAGFRKGGGTRDHVTNIHWIIEKARGLKKKKSASLTVLKPLTVWITTNYGKFWKRWEYQTTLPVSWDTCLQVKKQQLELDMEQQTGSELGKEYIKAVYCHLAYLIYESEIAGYWVVSDSLWPHGHNFHVTSWTVVHQASLSIWFPRQEYWSELPFPSPGDLPNSEIRLSLLHCR